MYSFFHADITKKFDIPSEHAYITQNYGSSCGYSGEPYINNCDFDLAQESLTSLYGPLNPAVPQISSNLF
jgi:hypothetical protein